MLLILDAIVNVPATAGGEFIIKVWPTDDAGKNPSGSDTVVLPSPSSVLLDCVLKLNLMIGKMELPFGTVMDNASLTSTVILFLVTLSGFADTSIDVTVRNLLTVFLVVAFENITVSNNGPAAVVPLMVTLTEG